MRKLIITAALTGGTHDKAANPSLPEQPNEIIEQALQCRDAGAAIVHIHARDKQGKPTAGLNIFREILDGITRSSDLIVQLSTGSQFSSEERMSPLSLRAEMSVIDTFKMVSRGDNQKKVLVSPRTETEFLAKRIQDMEGKPEILVIDISALDEVANLITKGLISRPYYLGIGLNLQAQGALKGTPNDLMHLIERLPKDTIFSVWAYGEAQLSLTTMSMLIGGHARVGLEDNIYYAPGRLARSNVELVARAVRIAKELNLEIATPNEAREILQIHK